MKYLKLFFVPILLLCLASVVFLTACGEEPEKPSETPSTPPKPAKVEKAGPIYVGLMIPQSGPLAAVGGNMVLAAEKAVKEANEERKQAGEKRMLELAVQDEDRLNDVPKEKRFAADKNVAVVVGHLYEKSLKDLRSEYIEAGLPVILPVIGSVEAVNMGDGYFFSTMPDDETEAAALAEFAEKKLTAKNILIVYDESKYGEKLNDSFKAAFSKDQGAVLVSMAFPDEPEKLLELSEKAKAMEPDAIFLALHAQPAIYIAQALHRAEVKAPILGTHAIAMMDTVAVLERGSEAVYISLPLDYKNADIKAAEFIKKWEADLHTPPDWPAVKTYDAVKLATRALKDSKVDRERTKAFFDNLSQQTEPVEGLAGMYAFKSKGLCSGPVYIVKADSSLFGRIP